MALHGIPDNEGQLGDLKSLTNKVTETRMLVRQLKAERLSLLTERSKIKSRLEEKRVVDAWCADLSTTLSGEAATIEVDSDVKKILVRPGFVDGAGWDPRRDGQLTPPWAQTPSGLFYAMALWPGWQKWTPRHRIGVVTATKGGKLDVRLLDARSRAQQLGLNAKTELKGVPVVYMDCGARPFAVGDRVLVEFLQQSWGSPYVIGFESNPRPCGPPPVFAVLMEKPTALHALGYHDDVWNVRTSESQRPAACEVFLIDPQTPAPALSWDALFEVKYCRLDPSGPVWISEEQAAATHDARASWDAVLWRRVVSLDRRDGTGTFAASYLLGQRMACPERQLMIELPGGPTLTVAVAPAGVAAWTGGRSGAVWLTLDNQGVRQSYRTIPGDSGVTEYMEYQTPGWWTESIGAGQKPRLLITGAATRPPGSAEVVGRWLVGSDDPSAGDYVYHSGDSISIGEAGPIDAIKAGLHIWPYSLLQDYVDVNFDGVVDYTDPWPPSRKCLCVVERMALPEGYPEYTWFGGGIFPGTKFIVAMGHDRAFVDAWLLDRLGADPGLDPSLWATRYDGSAERDEGPFGGRVVQEYWSNPDQHALEWTEVDAGPAVAASAHEVMRGPSDHEDACEPGGVLGNAWSVVAATRPGGGWTVWAWGGWIDDDNELEIPGGYWSSCYPWEQFFGNGAGFACLKVELSAEGDMLSAELEPFEEGSPPTGWAGRDVVLSHSGGADPWATQGCVYTRLSPGQSSHYALSRLVTGNCQINEYYEDPPAVTLANYEHVAHFGPLNINFAEALSSAIPAGGRVVGATMLAPKAQS